MPASFDYPRGVELWAPLAPGLAAAAAAWKSDVLRNVGVLYLVGRLRPGVDRAHVAAEELSSIARSLEAGGAAPRIGEHVVLQPFLDHVIGPTRPALWALFGGVAVLLGIACANVSGLMLTRVALRERDRAVRLALGASRRALTAEWVVETLVLAARWRRCGGLLHGEVAGGGDRGPRTRGHPAPGPGRPQHAGGRLRRSGHDDGGSPLRPGAGPSGRRRSTWRTTLKEDGRSSTGARTLRARSGLLVVQIGLAVRAAGRRRPDPPQLRRHAPDRSRASILRTCSRCRWIRESSRLNRTPGWPGCWRESQRTRKWMRRVPST